MLSFTRHFTPLADSSARTQALFDAITLESSQQTSGYYKLPFDTHALQKATDYAARAELAHIKHLVIIGVGGSSLGVRAIDSALKLSANRNAIKLHFLEHTDPFAMQESLESIDIHATHFLLISKSGTTIESIALIKFLIQRFDLLHTHKHRLCCITDESSPLEQFANKHKIACFCIPSNVGGRFSVLSLVGLVPLALLGYDIAGLLMGARSMMEGFFTHKESHIIEKALFLADNAKNLPISVLFSYGSVFSDINRWFVQLWGESLGKIDSSGRSIGLTPVGLVGSIDQHSFLQLIVQGTRDKFVSFLALDETSVLDGFVVPDVKLESLESTDFVNGTPFLRLLNLQKQATLETLESCAIPTDSITLEKLDEWHIGALVVYFELLTSCTGLLLGVNAYDQPGVEFGKQRLRSYFD